MTKHKKVLDRILHETSDKNIKFTDLSGLLVNFGFQERVKGSHHIFTKAGVDEIINLQPTHDHKAKPYQVKQVRNLIKRYNFDDRI